MPMHGRAGSVQPRTEPAEEVSITTRSQTRDLSRERDEWLTVEEVCAELKISRRTFDRWRATGKAPRCKPLPGGTLRIRRSWLEAWLDAPDEDIA